jgi:2-dehydropantoate 2-reductase
LKTRTAERTEDYGPILIVGCGGIGGVLGATLHRAGVPVCLATPNEDVRRVWTTTGPFLGKSPATHPLNPANVRSAPTDFDKPFRTIFVAVQPPQIELVTRQIRERLESDGRVVCLSNGLCEDVMKNIIDPSAVVGAVVSWGARMPASGHYTRTSSGGFRVGKLTQTDDPRLQEISALLRLVGPVRGTSNLKGARFAKLTINCAVTALGTIGGATLGELLVAVRPRSLALAVMRECAEVALAAGVTMEPVTKVDLGKLAGGNPSRKMTRVAQHALLLLAGTRYRKLRSSMLAAMERGREPAIDYTNGEVVRLGKQYGVRAPYNEAAVRVVWEIFRGELPAGKEALARVEHLAKSQEKTALLA